MGITVSCKVGLLCDNPPISFTVLSLVRICSIVPMPGINAPIAPHRAAPIRAISAGIGIWLWHIIVVFTPG